MGTIKHILALDIPDTSCENILRITDASVYADSLGIDCPRLDIYLPGFTTPIYIGDDVIEAGFTKNFSGIDFKLQYPDDTSLQSLPDGIYQIKYSVSPNDKVNVEYYHLRTTTITNKYFAEICKIRLETCEATKEQKQKMNDLRYIKMYIDAAKAKAEYCHSPIQAVEMLSYANKLLDKYMTGCCLTCK